MAHQVRAPASLPEDGRFDSQFPRVQMSNVFSLKPTTYSLCLWSLAVVTSLDWGLILPYWSIHWLSEETLLWWLNMSPYKSNLYLVVSGDFTHMQVPHAVSSNAPYTITDAVFCTFCRKQPPWPLWSVESRTQILHSLSDLSLPLETLNIFSAQNWCMVSCCVIEVLFLQQW